MKVEIKQVKLSEIKLNPDNPRTISKKDMDLLIKSLKEFPDMLKLREIVVDETMTVLGGNMRLLALKKSGAKEATAKIVTGLTKEQKREFVIKDNSPFGSWDMDALANAWGDLPLSDWGIKDDLQCLDGSSEEKLKQEEKELHPYKKIHVLISIDVDASNDVIELLDNLRKIEGVEIEQSAN